MDMDLIFEALDMALSVATDDKERDLYTRALAEFEKHDAPVAYLGFIGCDKRSDEAVDMSSEDGYRTWMLYADKCEHYTQFDYQEPSPPKQTPFCQWITCDKDSIPADLNYVVNIILIGSDESSGPHLVKDVKWEDVAFFQIIAIRDDTK